MSCIKAVTLEKIHGRKLVVQKKKKKNLNFDPPELGPHKTCYQISF